MSLRLTPEQVAAHQARVHAVPEPADGCAPPVLASPLRAPTLHLPSPPERDVLAECLEALAMCPAVAWSVRMNTGGAWLPGKDHEPQFVKFAFKGCSDIIGQLVDGRFLAVECKRKGKNPTEDQQAFLTRVAANGGMAFVARCAEDVFNHLRQAPGRPRA